jgi:hypothetical protein
MDASVNCTDTFADGDAGKKVNDAAGLDDGEDDDEEEDESPQAEATNAPSRMTRPARHAREGSV